MFRDQSFGKKTEETIPGTSIEMLNLNTLKSYRFALSQTQNLVNLREVDDTVFCEQVNITRNGLLTYAGLLMFGKAPYVLRYVPTFCVDYIEIPGPTIQQAEVRYTYRIPEQDNIWEAVQIILRRFRTLVDAPIHIKDEGFATTDESQYKVLREALANMVMHCDHFDSLRSCIRVYTDHIRVHERWNSPSPRQRHTRKDLLQVPQPDHRKTIPHCRHRRERRIRHEQTCKLGNPDRHTPNHRKRPHHRHRLLSTQIRHTKKDTEQRCR